MARTSEESLKDLLEWVKAKQASTRNEIRQPGLQERYEAFLHGYDQALGDVKRQLSNELAAIQMLQPTAAQRHNAELDHQNVLNVRRRLTELGIPLRFLKMALDGE